MENQLKEQVSDKAHEWQDKAGNLAAKAKVLAGRVQHTARDAHAAADLYVRQYAWTSVALVAIAAFAVGVTVGRSRR